MLQALIGPIANLAGSWMESKVEQTKAKGAVAKARAEAEAQVMVTAATHEAGWEKIMAQASDNSWKDEAWTILFIIIIALCFIPFTQPDSCVAAVSITVSSDPARSLDTPPLA